MRGSTVPSVSRALEKKKRDMALAEEERRRKALEERRQAQKEATDRCKLAISRLRGSSHLSSSQNTETTCMYIRTYVYPKCMYNYIRLLELAQTSVLTIEKLLKLMAFKSHNY